MLVGATLGGENPTRPIPALGGLMGQAAQRPEAQFVAVKTVAELESFLGQARAAGQPVMVDFTADWCTSCKEMEAYTFPDPAVVAALEPFMLLRADVTANDRDDQALMQHFGVFGPPQMRFFDRGGDDLDAYRLAGFMEADEFAAHVTTVASL
jgi:thiol:disulfide interchange protein DsbD